VRPGYDGHVGQCRPAPAAKEDVVSDDDTEREPQNRDGEDSASRPATAAARRERRSASNRSVGRAASPSDSDSDTTRKGRPTPAVQRREERVSPISKSVRFLREVVAELRKVIWPTRKELVTYTAVVLVFVSFMVALIALLDIAFAKGVLWLFG
jgi:preprotein translocase subunit SecE